MRSGYGRGYYGVGQLDRHPAARRGSGWGKIAIVVGVGAVVWLLWPRRPKFGYAPGPEYGSDAPKPPSPPPSFEGPPGQIVQLEGQPTQIAEARGYPSQQAYEDAVIASARQLQDAGAKVMLAPHLEHLAPRLEQRAGNSTS